MSTRAPARSWPATIALANELAHAGGAGLVPDSAEGAESAEDWMSAHVGIDHTGEKTLAHTREALGIDGRVQGLIEAEGKAVMEKLAGDG